MIEADRRRSANAGASPCLVARHEPSKGGRLPSPALLRPAGEGGATPGLDPGGRMGCGPPPQHWVGLHERHPEPSSSHPCFPHPIRPPSPLRGEGGARRLETRRKIDLCEFGSVHAGTWARTAAATPSGFCAQSWTKSCVAASQRGRARRQLPCYRDDTEFGRDEYGRKP